jgi:hypothetical protein
VKHEIGVGNAAHIRFVFGQGAVIAMCRVRRIHEASGEREFPVLDAVATIKRVGTAI